MVFGTSSRLGTGYLAYKISKLLNKKLALDIRDIFSDSLSSLKISKLLIFKPFLKFMVKTETKICNEADWLNFVSPGFKKYDHLNELKNKPHVFTNGIDEIFIKNRLKKIKVKNKSKKLIITYAGNIGYGQGLEKTVVQISNYFKNEIIFQLIGDGSSVNLIKDQLEKYKTKNVFIYPPVQRNKLIKYYNKSDVLFLQLNDFEVFKKVLPSKIFDYGSYDKPILAGVDGESKKFLSDNFKYSYIFHPSKYEQAIEKIKEIKKTDLSNINNNEFVKNYDRDKIMNRMTKSLNEINL